jgi:hypothetical protein
MIENKKKKEKKGKKNHRKEEEKKVGCSHKKGQRRRAIGRPGKWGMPHLQKLKPEGLPLLLLLLISLCIDHY